MCMCACTCIPSLVYDDNFTSKCTRFNLREPIFQKFPGGMPPDPPKFGMLCMQVCFAHYKRVFLI